MSDTALAAAKNRTKQFYLRKATSQDKTVTISKTDIDAVLFDMDGVVTRTADVHAAAWKKVFDQLLSQKAAGSKPFDIESDYHTYVDGKARYDGAASFLESRHINLPRGDKSDKPGLDTVCAIGNLKDQIFLEQLKEHHAQAYETTVALIQSLKHAGIKVAVITASENGSAVLKAANLQDIFDTKVDGLDAIALHLNGKPEPDVFLQAARELNVKPGRAIVVEDAVAGVEAGSKGKFALVIGVDRNHSAERLKENGADVVVKDLAEVGVLGHDCESPGMALSNLGICDKNWIVKYEDFVPALEKRREALCALGNGYFVTRACAAESIAGETHFPGTYFAGLYNRLQNKVADRSIETEDLVNTPNWLSLTFKIGNGSWFDLSKVKIIQYGQSLNLQQGILYRYVKFKDEHDRETSINERRFVHMRYHHYAGLEVKLTCHNWSDKLTIRHALDGRVLNDMSVYSNDEPAKRHLAAQDASINDNVLYLEMQTIQSHITIAEACKLDVFHNDQPCQTQRNDIIENNYVAQDIELTLKPNDQVVMQKTVAFFTSRDFAISEPGLAARKAIENSQPFDELIFEQIQAWRELWERFDLAIETKEDTPKVSPSLLLHLNSFQALCTVSIHTMDLDIGMPARGWSEGYQGHIFWDDLYMFPLVNWRAPMLTQSLLKYRYRRLGEARKIAESMGVRGARFPWQSASTGREETPAGWWDDKKKTWNPDFSHMQIHVNAAIVFNTWQYYQITGDLNFMYMYGADIILEIARFFATFAKYNAQRKRYEIHGVVGPDEFHVQYPKSKNAGINNNAYTNVMAAWSITKALELLKILPEIQCNAICERLKITPEEINLWQQVSTKIFVPILRGGIIAEFEGYEKLKEFPTDKNGFIDFDRVPEILKETAGLPNDYKITKQPDVLMLFYLFSAEELTEIFERLNYRFDPACIPKNVDYYLRQTASKSSLSRVALAWVLSRANRPKAWKHLSNISAAEDKASAQNHANFPHSWDIFNEALSTDFIDQGGTTAQGIHLGAMAGTIDIVQRCYTGIVTKDDILWINPCLPEDLTRLTFSLLYRNQLLRFEITQTTAKVTASKGDAQPVKIGFKEEVYEFEPGTSKNFVI